MRQHLRLLPLIVLFAAALLPAAAYAGEGEVADGKLNLNVIFTYGEDDPDAWRPLFEESSRLLFNATNGQLQLGRIRVLSCGTDKDAADVWVLDDNSGAFANVLGLGGIGHVFISQTHKSVSDEVFGPFGLVHELGHYVFGLYDEYKPAPGDPLLAEQRELVGARVPNQFCVTEDDPLASVMDGGTTVAPNNHRTEFCTHAHGGLSTAHNEGMEIGGVMYVNAQQTLNGESCWETIARNVGLTPPAQVETQDPPGLQPLEWEITPGLHRVVLAVDRSFSMYIDPAKIGLAKEAGGVLVDLFHGERTVDVGGVEIVLPGEYVNLVAFGNEAEEVLPFRELVDAQVKEAVRDAIEGIPAEAVSNNGAMGTDLGGALRFALDAIHAEGEVPACGEAIILLSDAGHDTGTDPAEVIPDLVARGVRVYAVAVGLDADLERAREIAEATGGKMFILDGPEDLPGVTSEIGTLIRSLGTMQINRGTVDGQDESLPMQIDSFAEEVTVLLQWDEGSLDLVLTSPTGDVIDLDSAEIRGDVEGAREEKLLYLRIAQPERGEWTATIRPLDLLEESRFEMRAFDENSSVSFRASVERTAVAPGEPIPIRADVIADVPVAGVECELTVIPPVGVPTVIDSFIMQLYDDGDAANGDQWAGDGVYHAIVPGLAPPGVYKLRIWAMNENGSGPDPDLPFVEDGGVPPISVPPFRRKAEVEIVVENPAPPLGGTARMVLAPPGDLEGEPPARCVVSLAAAGAVDRIHEESIRVNGRPLRGIGFARVEDSDDDGENELVIVIEPAIVDRLAGRGLGRSLAVAGLLDDMTPFECRAAFDRVAPDPGAQVEVGPSSVAVGSVAVVSWPRIAAPGTTHEGFLAVEGSRGWRKIFTAPSGADRADWLVDAPCGARARVLLQTSGPEGVLTQALSRPFVIEEGVAAADAAPGRTLFLGASPNPARGATSVGFSLARESDVRLDIYSPDGRLVRRLVDARLGAGEHSAAWDGTSGDGTRLPSGVYLTVFRSGETTSKGRLMLLR